MCEAPAYKAIASTHHPRDVSPFRLSGRVIAHSRQSRAMRLACDVDSVAHALGTTGRRLEAIGLAAPGPQKEMGAPPAVCSN